MSDKVVRPQPRLPKGMRDIDAAEMRDMTAMLGVIRRVYELYGFEPLDTPAFEFSDALGKFLPDADRPNEGVFSFHDEDEEWVSLRYDLTAPLARYVAANFDSLPKPFRRYQAGPVWRNEKPGPGRFRQFMQFDADTVGAAGPAADAEMCMLAADALEALGVPRGGYAVRVNNRKVLDGLMESAGIEPGEAGAGKRLGVLRAIDKLDRVGPAGVEQLLGKGRKDESGDFTKGAELKKKQIERIMAFLAAGLGDVGGLTALASHLSDSPRGLEGVQELAQIETVLRAGGFDADRVKMDATVVRGLEYYTGPVFEAELTFIAQGEDGAPIRFGSVGGGGRYDGLVERFKGVRIPATGFSIGVSRLYAALKALGKLGEDERRGPVIVMVLDRARIEAYQAIVQSLRRAGLRAEMYLGDAGLKAQMKYADKRQAPCVVIQGEDERQRGEAQIKDLIEGRRLSEQIADNVKWREERPAQFSVPMPELVDAVRRVVLRHEA
ncbi:MAG: histidine--tRNA ligase [Hyphomicrobiales bacterium]|nr:histidine--tRNA ligase [Hyphomicrobiales bacterium]